jgi:hypothetical protein
MSIRLWRCPTCHQGYEYGSTHYCPNSAGSHAIPNCRAPDRAPMTPAPEGAAVVQYWQPMPERRDADVSMHNALVALYNARDAGLVDAKVALRTLQADNARLAEALEKFGRHEAACALGQLTEDDAAWFEAKCQCGLAEALGRTK